MGDQGKQYLIEKINERVGTERVKQALLGLAETNIVAAWEFLYRWEVANAAERDDIAMLYEPMEGEDISAADYMGQLKEKAKDGTPTSLDLAKEHTCPTCKEFIDDCMCRAA